MNNFNLTLACCICMALLGCEQKAETQHGAAEAISPVNLDDFIRTTKANLVFVKGGEFLMGDFGVEYGPEKLPYDSNPDSSPLHRVELTSYSIDRFKITNQAYQLYLKLNGLSMRNDDDKLTQISSFPMNPAHMDWHEAERYCQWLAKVTDLPFALPTEAQWEYAARSRGQFLMVATDDGTYKTTDTDERPRGINISTFRDRGEFAEEQGWNTGILTPLPVDRFPPNPLGLYSMTDNGWEWVKDWYDPNYYQTSPVKDPQGPKEPVFKAESTNNKYAKVMRGIDYPNARWGGGLNVQRKYANQEADFYSVVNNRDLISLSDKTVRCVVNSSDPIK
ncbi:SUMF1/EgtB/PvdO family nonheme iron enzyme [Pseudomonas sp. PSE14]|uniref:formylglycine-generating enzyme family protein n=1 Tax=Pseudomonas sp. PSE14 TaxID=3016341 RepID=UPI0023D83E19|nr:SUMF1/EgtB/PvdO family nonheme iron enzyme [Pseudomonas sp. PSE14]WEJ73073.1 SUMF1/EgtB/PvdO family nonheme iron enzyme [Pseudomonas sp. PSE14]